MLQMLHITNKEIWSVNGEKKTSLRVVAAILTLILWTLNN